MIRTIEYAIAHWESQLETRRLSLKESQGIVNYLWDQYSYPEVFLDTAPTVVFVSDERKYSCYRRQFNTAKEHHIELIPKHQDVVSVLHELAHALAIDAEHTPRWRRQFCQLLSHVFEGDAEEILEELETFIDKYLKNA